MNSNQENLNKKIEESKKVFEKMFGGSCSYHEDDRWGRKDGVFTIKLGNYNEEKNIEILTGLEKAAKGIAGEHPVNFEIKGSDGKLTKVSKEEFAKWMENEKNIKTPPKESLVYGASGDIDGTTVFVERKGKDSFIRESYYEPRSEEEKKQIIERNQKRRELEKSQRGNSSTQPETGDIDLIELAKEISKENNQIENSPNSDKQQSENKEINQQNFSQKPDNKELTEKGNNDNQQNFSQKNDNKNIYYGIGVISLVLLVIGMAIVSAKKKRKLK